jgi:hypothetical protein
MSHHAATSKRWRQSTHVNGPLARCRPAHCPWVGHAGERFDRRLSHGSELLRIAEVLGPRSPVGKMKSFSGSVETEA